MQKTTSSTIISVALLALLVWALSSGKEDVKPRKKSEETLLAKKTPWFEKEKLRRSKNHRKKRSGRRRTSLRQRSHRKNPEKISLRR